MSDFDDRAKAPGSVEPTSRTNEPGWAEGLRKLYNDVVAEPLPESFDDLLKRLDQSDNG